MSQKFLKTETSETEPQTNRRRGSQKFFFTGPDICRYFKQKVVKSL